MSLSSNATEFVPFSTYNWGQNGPYKLTARLPWNPIVYCLIASLHAIAFWMSLELTIHLFYTFKRQGTLYFWSILLTTWALVISTILEDLVIWVFPLSNLAILAVQRTSTAIVYAGFSVVLYSRLHLITRNLTLLRAIIWTIIATAILCNLPNILNMCIPSLLRNPLVYKITYGSQVVFALQEVMLSSLYIYLYYKFVRGGSFEPRDKMTFILLILAQIVILVSDVGMIVLIYVRLYLGRMALVPFTYAFKLRLEFVVLNRLAEPNNTARNLICGSQRSVPDPQVFDNPRDIGWKSWFGFLQWRRRELPTAQNLGGEKVDIATRAENTEQEAPGQRDCFSQITTHDISKIPYSCCVCRKMSFCSRATPESRADADSDSLDIEARYLGRFEAERMV